MFQVRCADARGHSAPVVASTSTLAEAEEKLRDYSDTNFVSRKQMGIFDSSVNRWVLMPLTIYSKKRIA